jgi:hypothetical protein
MKFGLARIIASVALAMAGSTMASANLIVDTFETDSSGNYTVVDDGTPNGTTNFSFDYVAAGIPLAPRSAPGETRGLRFTANDSAAATDALTAFHSTSVGGSYKLSVDVFMGYALPPSASTEYAHVGVGGNGTTFNSVFTPISGSGAYIAFTGDGGSASDYRWFRDSANTPIGDGSSTTLPNTHPSYLGNGSNNTNAFFSNTLFPATTGTTVVGSPGNIWTTVDVTVDNGTISFAFNGTLTFQGAYAGNLDGLVSLGLADTFTSVDAGDVFTLYDNLTVTAVPEPSSIALVGLGVIGIVARRRQVANRKVVS